MPWLYLYLELYYTCCGQPRWRRRRRRRNPGSCPDSHINATCLGFKLRAVLLSLSPERVLVNNATVNIGGAPATSVVWVKCHLNYSYTRPAQQVLRMWWSPNPECPAWNSDGWLYLYSIGSCPDGYSDITN